jgi:hypothetical protein
VDKRPIWQTQIFLSIVVFVSSQTPLLAKTQKLETHKILINAGPESVFEALRIERDAPECHRKTLSFDGKVAEIDECTYNVPIYGEVHNVWEETEFPPQKMDYKLILSNHFKAGFGSWVIVPSEDKMKTTLELHSNLDSGLRIPFGDQITRISASSDARERLTRLKAIAERQPAAPKTILSSASQSK